MKYRKKPVVIDAWQNIIHSALMPDWLLHGMQVGFVKRNFGETKFYINTLEGVMTADLNDWIIRGIKGEIYPCKPDIFEATYEKVE